MSKNITYTNKDNFRINRYAYIMQLEHYKDLIEIILDDLNLSCDGYDINLDGYLEELEKKYEKKEFGNF